jgi:hypothetical protein
VFEIQQRINQGIQKIELKPGGEHNMQQEIAWFKKL